MYLWFAIETLHNWHLGVQQIVKECMVLYLQSETVTVEPTNAGWEQIPLMCKKQFMQHDFSDIGMSKGKHHVKFKS